MLDDWHTGADVPAAAVKVEGWLYKEAAACQGVVHSRYGVLYPTIFVSFHNDDNKGSSRQQCWPLHRTCQLSTVKQKNVQVSDCNNSNKHYRASSQLRNTALHTFTVSWPAKHPLLSGGQLSLGFASEEAVQEWHNAFEACLKALHEDDHPASDPLHSNTAAGVTEDISKGPDDSAAHHASEGPNPPCSLDDLPLLQAGICMHSRQWITMSHADGIAVYRERDADAFMMAMIVGADPSSCFQALMQDTSQACWLFGCAASAPAAQCKHTRSVQASLHAEGLLGWVCSKRELRGHRTWRREDDGSYIMLVRGTKQSNNLMRTWWDWSKPVPAVVQAAGLTIVPVQAYECLVTMVLHIDLGGWLSVRHPLVRPLISRLAMAYLRPLLMSLISLRDQVECDLGRSAQSVKTGSNEGSAAPDISLQSSTSSERSRHTDIVYDGFGRKAAWPQRGTCDPQYWSCPGSAGFKVRGPSYLADRRKVPAGDPMFDLVAVDLIQLPEPNVHLARFLPPERFESGFTFLLQFMVPPNLALLVSWATHHMPANTSSQSHKQAFSGMSSTRDNDQHSSAFDTCLSKFLTGDDSAADQCRNGTLKLVPSVVHGSWVIRQAVGSTPVLLGRKVPTRYFRGDGYFEVDVDVGGSVPAASVIGLVTPCTKSFTVDLGVILEGHSHDELPEQLLGTVRFDHMDLKPRAFLNSGTNAICFQDS